MGCLLLHWSVSDGQTDRRDDVAADELPVWRSDQGDGSYKNPILFADYSDPDAIRVGDSFYLTASSFNCTPGLPVLESKDLVNWRIIGHALSIQLPRDIYDKPQHGNGVWAPAIRWNKGEFYIYYPDPDYGIYVIRAKNPAGPWTAPALVVSGKGLIDPCPLFEPQPDGTQKVWLANAWAASRAEVNSLLTIRPLTPDGMHEAGEAKMVFDGHDRQPTVEGPKLYKRNGYYYILAPAGGVVNGWQLALRSRNIYGPYEEKIVMDQGTTNINGPHQGAWVETKTGESWFIHFQDRGPYGRVTHLQPMQWIGDWPVIGVDKDRDGKGEPVLVYKKPDVGRPGTTPGQMEAQASDEFNGNAPELQWQWHANPQIAWSAEIPGSGHLRLFAIKAPDSSKNLWQVPNLLLQKLSAPDFSATTRMTLTVGQSGKKAGLLVMGGDYAYLAVEKQDSGYVIVQTVCRNAEQGAAEQIIATIPSASPGNTIDLRVDLTAPDALCHFSYSLDGRPFKLIGSPFYAKQDKWIGAKIGLFCLSPAGSKNGGYADFDWFRVRPASPDTFDVDRCLRYCVEQAKRTLAAWKATIPPIKMPRSIAKGDSAWKEVPVQDWTSGFWPGILWYVYAYTKDDHWKREADYASRAMSPVAYQGGFDHDLGFMLYCSLGNGYRLTGDTTYKRTMLAGADSLATLFNPKVGTILSWPSMVAKMGWPHNTIIDNMINLELLFWAARNGGGRRLYDMAVRHAETTMHNHFRPDHSAYHVVVYDTVTGKKIKGVTHQGYSDASMWARGQTWAMYGFTMCYRETHQPDFLAFAQQVTDIYLQRLPPDGIPYWDFDDPAIPDAPRDASAAAVAASALLELSGYVSDKDKAVLYRHAAEKMLATLSSSAYRSDAANPAFLLHATGHKPAGSEIDASIIYGDYYYIEALLRLKQLKAKGQIAIDFTNPLRESRKDELIVMTRTDWQKRLGTIPAGKYVQLSDAGHLPVVVQFDDLDGDGIWDETCMVHSFTASETWRVLATVTDQPATIKAVVRAHVRMRAKRTDDSFAPSQDTASMPAGNLPTDFSRHRLPPWLTEGPAWENDKVAYRLYFDTRNGKDIYGKRIPAMVMDFVGVNPDSNYHQLDYWGMDILKVGNSLGAGSLAMSIPRQHQKDTLIRLGGMQVKKETYRELANGPLRAVFRLDYDWVVDGKPVKVTEEISISAGQYFYTSKVIVRGAPGGARLVTGIANFYSNTPGHLAKDAAQVLYSYGHQSENHDLLGMSILVGNKDYPTMGSRPAVGTDVTNTYTVAQKISGDRPLYFRYYTCWEKTDQRFASRTYFVKLLQQETGKFSHPITIH